MRPSVVIVGGGVVGSAAACFLARDHGLAPVVLERDPRYTVASSTLSASGLRQQFSTEVNIRLSQASLAFLRRAADELAVDGEPAVVPWLEAGYLTLAGSDAGAVVLRERHALQRRCGADIALLAPDALQARFPWLRTDDLRLGAWGATGEGWTDGWALLQALRRKARACGARFEAVDATRLDMHGARVRGVVDAAGRTWAADEVLLCAGAWSAALLAPLGIDLPVRPERRDVFVFDSPAPVPGCPLVIDPSGLWFRPEGTGWLCGAPPRRPSGPVAHAAPSDHIDHAQFDDVLWPALAHRVPGFEALRRRSAWAGYYDMNTFDHNALIGAWPGLDGLLMACGFSGHGLQQAPAAAQALVARLTGTPAWVDVAPLSPARVDGRRPLRENHVI